MPKQIKSKQNWQEAWQDKIKQTNGNNQIKPKRQRDGAVVKNTCHSSKGSALGSQHSRYNCLYAYTHGRILTCTYTCTHTHTHTYTQLKK